MNLIELKGHLWAHEKETQPFRDSLNGLNKDFYTFLARQYTKKTANKHTMIVDLFIIFLCDYTDARDIQSITKGMINSQFRFWWKRKVCSSETDNDLNVALKKLFNFLAQEQFIVNEVAIKPKE